jgi:hypothetical protein
MSSKEADRTYWKYRIQPGIIDLNHLELVALKRVSKSSWMPHFRLIPPRQKAKVPAPVTPGTSAGVVRPPQNIMTAAERSAVILAERSAITAPGQSNSAFESLNPCKDAPHLYSCSSTSVDSANTELRVTMDREASGLAALRSPVESCQPVMTRVLARSEVEGGRLIALECQEDEDRGRERSEGSEGGGMENQGREKTSRGRKRRRVGEEGGVDES